MIDNALKFIASEVNKYVVRKLDPQQDPSIKKLIQLGNVAKAQDDNQNNNPLLGLGIVSLVNVEEDRISKSPDNFIKVYDRVRYKSPKVFLNLYVLFSVYHSSYDTSLQYLSLIIQFFQYKNVVDHENSPSSSDPRLDPKIEQLVFDMVTLNFEQVNHLWGTLGGKYLPSVLYKMRLITIDDETPETEAGPVMEVALNGAQINPR